MTDTRTLYRLYRLRRSAINHAKDALAYGFALAALYGVWLVFG